MTTILGIDLGAKRIGVAVADDDGAAVPLTTLRRARDVAGGGLSGAGASACS